MKQFLKDWVSSSTWMIIGGLVALILLAASDHPQAQIDRAYGGWNAIPLPTITAEQCGDINNDGKITVADAQLIAMLMQNIWKYDVNGDNKIDMDDANYLVNYIYSKGDAPVAPTICRSIRVYRMCMEGFPIE